MNMTGDFCGYKKQSFYLKINSCLFIRGIVSYWVDSDRIYQETAVWKMALAAFLLVILIIISEISSLPGKACLDKCVWVESTVVALVTKSQLNVAIVPV